MVYRTKLPLLKTVMDVCAVRDIPRIAEWEPYKVPVRASELLRNLLNTQFEFEDYNRSFPNYELDPSETAIVSVSFGKDSLLTYAVASELELKPKAVFIRDMFDHEAIHKLKAIKSFEHEFNTKVTTIIDTTDYIYTDKYHVNLVVTNAMNGYNIMMLPVAYYFKSKYIMFGNQYSLNNYYFDDEGYKCYISYDQSSTWILEQDFCTRVMTQGKVRTCSIIEPLYDIAIMKILHHRYPQFGKYQISCGLDGGARKSYRWCHFCSKCAKFYIIAKALGVDVKQLGFADDLLKKGYKLYYPLFDGVILDIDDRTQEARDEQLLAFYIAFNNNRSGELMELFKKEYLEEAKAREDELYKRFFGIQDSLSIPDKFKSNVISIYREELTNPI
jgi:hypothetical protein